MMDLLPKNDGFCTTNDEFHAKIDGFAANSRLPQGEESV